MAFFRNDAVNRFNLHYGISSIAGGMGGVFFLAFLLHAGVPIPITLLAQVGIVALRFVIRPVVVPIGKALGLKPMLILGQLLMAAQFPMLAEVHGLNVWLGAVVVGAAVADIFYWPAFHAYFAAVGDPEHRGHQIGMREAIAAVVNIGAPLLGAYLLVTQGPLLAFSAASGVGLLAIIPLIGAPNVAIPKAAGEAYRAGRMGMALFVTDGWLAACFYFVWQVVLFVSLGSSLAAFGGAVALAALAGAVAGLFLGRFIDLGHGRRAAIVAYSVTALIVAFRGASVGSPWLAVISNAIGALVGALTVPAMMSAVYNMAKASPDPFRFHVVSEGGWDIGCGAGCLVAAGIAALGGSLAWAIWLAIPVLGVTAWLLWRYYGAHPIALDLDMPELDAPHLAESHPP